jgi:hypothetical protein
MTGPLSAAHETAWSDIPGVWAVGLVLGVVIIGAAIRYMARHK